MSINKQELYYKCLDIINERIDKYEDELRFSVDSSNNQELGNNFEEQIARGEVLADSQSLAERLNHLRGMKENLLNIDPSKKYETVQLGSVVETEKHYYFIAAALGEIDMEDGSKVFAISTASPIYGSLEGKKSGNEILFENEKISILALH